MNKIISFFLCFLSATGVAQNNMSWHGKKAAVVLTYDDALNVHLTNAVPALDSHGLKATFYLSDYFGGFAAQINGWRKAAAAGHELGNHTVYHPCLGNLPGRSFVKADYDLNNYSFRRITDEIRTMNTLLKAIDGKEERTFAYPCSDRTIRDTPYFPDVQQHFVAARAVRNELEELRKVDLFNISSFMVNGQSGTELIGQVLQAMEKNRMLVFLFHGVGGEHSLDVSLQAHRELLQFLKNNQQDIWVAPMINVARHIRQQQQGISFAQSRDSIGELFYQDHRRMMRLLLIDSLRQGMNGNDPAAPNAANYYLETHPSVDAKKVGIEGHSRFGKAALVAMAYDPRFAIAFISSSGAAGAKLHRCNAGEVVKNVAASGEYHWMAGNYLKYAGPLQWNDLPVDLHELIALCAPRPLFISAGYRGDGWVDARGMFMATAAAGAVFRLLGKKDLGTQQFPSVETGIMEGELAFRQHNGGHTPGPNWPFFLAFAGRYFNRK